VNASFYPINYFLHFTIAAAAVINDSNEFDFIVMILSPLTIQWELACFLF
jgi:hypothetical protein